MARKTVKINFPDNVQDLISTAAAMLTRNDGAPPAIAPVNPSVIDIAARLGVAISITTPTTPTGPTPPPGTGLIPTNLLAPLRTLYPQLARDVMTLATLREYTEALSTSIMNRLGIAAGQTLESGNTVRSVLSHAAPVLKSLLAGNENEIETYGLHVTIGTTAGGNGGTTPTTQK